MAGRRRQTRAGPSEEYVGRNTEMFVERAHHVHVQGAAAAQDLVHARSSSETMCYVDGLESGLVHAEPDRLDRVGWVDRNSLALMGLDDQGKEFDLVLLVPGRVFKVPISDSILSMADWQSASDRIGRTFMVRLLCT